MTCLLLLVALHGAVAAPPVDAVRRTPVVVAVERATPAVVSLEVEVEPQSSGFPFFAAQPTQSQGSGVIIDASGLVLTNAHVVRGARSIRAHLVDGRSFSGDLVALDDELDLAVVKLDGATGLIAAVPADSDQLWLGETTLAIGNPLGLGLTVSTGVVSSVRREVEIQPGVHQSYIQTDAAINPGNSGGALIDLEGRLIGINTAIRADAEGIGFAIPVNRARKIADDLLSFGSVRAPWLGADVEDVNRRALVNTPYASGALRVTAVHAGGPAEAAGIRAGDLLVRAEGRALASRADLNAWLAERKPGTPVTLSYLRGGASERAAKLTTSSVPADAGVRALQDKLGVQLLAGQGALVAQQISPTGTWAAAGLRAGDTLLAVDGLRVSTPEALAELLTRAKAKHRPTALFTVQRGVARGHVTLEI